MLVVWFLLGCPPSICRTSQYDYASCSYKLQLFIEQVLRWRESLMYLSIQLLNLGTHHYLNSADKNLWAVTWERLTLLMIFFDYFYIYIYFDDKEPQQGRALQTHSCKVNFGPVHYTFESFPTRIRINRWLLHQEVWPQGGVCTYQVSNLGSMGR